MVDADGREYVDLVCSWGPMILGHAHPEVVAAVRGARGARVVVRHAAAGEVELAEEIVARVAAGRAGAAGELAAPRRRCRAIRLARGFTGRRKVVKFAGCYHGHVDALLASAGSGVATFGLPDTPGVTGAAGRGHDRAAVQRPRRGDGRVRRAGRPDRLRDHRGGRGEHGRGPAGPGLQRRRWPELCREHGALLVSDEVMTGFRVGPAGWYGLDAGATADLITFGKVMGGGLPAAAFGGRADVMAQLAPAGPVYQAGHAVREPGRDGGRAGHAAAAATTRSTPTSTRPRPPWAGWSRPRSTEAGVPHRLQTAGNLFSVFFADSPVRDFDDARRAGRLPRTPAFFHAMLDARRLPAAVGVRGVVRLGRARRRPRSSGSPRPCRRGPRGGRRPQPGGGR